MKKGTLSMVDMTQIQQKARVNANKKPAYDINLSHLSSWRQKTDHTNSKQDNTKLEMLNSFVKIRNLLQKELESICGEVPVPTATAVTLSNKITRSSTIKSSKSIDRGSSVYKQMSNR